MKNDELAHIWAHQGKAEAQTSTGNFSFVGRSLYSYRTEIARIIEGRYVTTTHYYSSTTEGKHKNALKHAVTHRELYYVAETMREVPDNWGEASQLIYKEKIRSLVGKIDRFKRSVSRIRDQIRAINSEAIALEGFRSENDLNAEDMGDLIHFRSKQNTTDSVLRDFFGVNVAEKIEREILVSAKKKEREDLLLATTREREKENIEAWRKGEYHGSLYHSPVMLRVVGEEIETSRGAKIPIFQAVLLWRALNGNEPRRVIGQTIGYYTITDLSPENIVIGCHTIPMEEIRSMAVTLKLTEEIQQNEKRE